ncbi:MAG: hypothetical protein L3J59_10040 [Methylococcaceae bacterium]|nr:hypothetical protein [Methylococcaceae bacterium]
MNISKNIAVYITGHGHGHLSQTIEVLIALSKKNQQMQFKIITSLPESVVIARIADKIPAAQFCYIHDKTNTDIGVPMIDAMQVDHKKTVASYNKIHSHWDDHIHFEEQRIRALNIDIVLSNVGYIPLQAATNLSIPSVALCSLDWASTWQVFGGDDRAGKLILSQIILAYQSANQFLQMTPHLPMLFLDNKVSVPFVVRKGKSKRQVLEEDCPHFIGKKLILISMGGMDAEIDFDQWPKVDRVIYIVTGNNCLPKGYYHADTIGLDFSDIMASVDIVLTKTGYGMVVESVVNQTPLFYVARENWPEHDIMLKWCKENNNVLEIDRGEFERGLTEDKIDMLLSQPTLNKVFEVETGTEICASHIQSLMRTYNIV